MSLGSFFASNKKAVKMLYNRTGLLSAVLRQMAVVKCLPFEVVDGSTEQIILHPIDAASSRKLTIRSYILAAILMTILLQVINGMLNLETTTMNEILLGGSSLLMLSILTTHCHQTIKRGRELTDYINGLLKFRKDMDKGDLYMDWSKFSLNEFLNMLFVPFALVNGAIFPPAFAIAFHWLNPCKISLAGYGLIYECQNRHESHSIGMMIISGIVKSAVLVGNWWAWNLGIHCTIFTVTGIEILCSFLMRDGIKS